MLIRARSVTTLLLAILIAPAPSFAFQSPLSDESIREAYFLGQRHDGSLERLLDKYTKHLPVPKQGPHIASITFLTPFMQVAKSSGKSLGNYSAQQAALDHRGAEETVEIAVEIRLTDSYGAIIADSTPPHSDRPQTYQLRPHDFWRDFQAEVLQGDEPVKPSNFIGEPNLVCPYRGTECTLIGATLHLEFPATAFNTDSATIHVIPPEGPEVQTDVDLTSLR